METTATTAVQRRHTAAAAQTPHQATAAHTPSNYTISISLSTHTTHTPQHKKTGRARLLPLLLTRAAASCVSCSFVVFACVCCCALWPERGVGRRRVVSGSKHTACSSCVWCTAASPHLQQHEQPTQHLTLTTQTRTHQPQIKTLVGDKDHDHDDHKHYRHKRHCYYKCYEKKVCWCCVVLCCTVRVQHQRERDLRESDVLSVVVPLISGLLCLVVMCCNGGYLVVCLTHPLAFYTHINNSAISATGGATTARTRRWTATSTTTGASCTATK